MHKRYDAVIIGAGHNGLTLGAYLARSGLDVVVLERRHEEGGGLCTEELTRPGFLHNIHANYHTFVDLAPPIEDLELRKNGVVYVRPEVQMASIFEDNTALCIYTDLDATVESMSRFSPADAETFKRLYTEAHGYVDLLLGTLMFQPPMSIKELTGALGTFGIEDRSEFLGVKLRRQSINQFLDQHFEHPKIKAHLAFHGAVCGYANDVVGLAIGFPLLIGKIDNWNLCVGGSHRLAHALWRDLAHHGGTLITDAEVVSIVVEDGQATGVRLSDGEEIQATKLVASTVDVEQTFLRFLGKTTGASADGAGDSVKEDAVGGISTELIDRVESRIAHQDWTLFSVHLALSEPPYYEAAEFNPDVNNAWVVNLGYESLTEMNRDWQDIRAGKLPLPKPNAAVNSLFDTTDAPAGCYTGLLRQFAPFSLEQEGPGGWEIIGRQYARQCIQTWERFAPNLSSDKAVLDWVPYTPLEISQKMINMVQGDWMCGAIKLDNMLDQRPLPELGGYKTPIGRLYMAGSTQHPHGFITFGPAYNALSVIADDLGIKPWWRRI